MERRALGRTGIEVSLLGMGTSEIGYQLPAGADCSRLLNSALDDGLTVIDTAECYMDSESKIGRAIAHRRDEYALFTKTGHAAGLDGDDWSPATMAAGIERSLRELRTDRVDLLQLHSCSLELLKAGDVIEVVKRAQERGQTRHLGYSGDGEAARWAVESGLFDVLQVSVNVCDQEAIDLVLPLAVEKGVGVVAKRPIANAVWAMDTPPESPYRRPYYDRLRALDYDWSKDSRLALNTSLRFTATCPGVSTMIVGTTKPGRWRENADVLARGPLSPDEFAAVRSRWRERAGADWVGLT